MVLCRQVTKSWVREVLLGKRSVMVWVTLSVRHAGNVEERRAGLRAGRGWNQGELTGTKVLTSPLERD